MPRGDRTGPWGLGPMTGRRMGYCAGYPGPGFLSPGPGFGYGRGFGLGRGMGYGRGRGWRRAGFGPFWGYPYPPAAPFGYPYGSPFGYPAPFPGFPYGMGYGPGYSSTEEHPGGSRKK